MHISSKMHEEGFQINNNFIFLNTEMKVKYI